MIKILICDDKLEWIDNLKESIKRVTTFNYDILTFTNPNDLLKYTLHNNADIVFIDIKLQPVNCIITAKTIHDNNSNIQIIFTSQKKDYIQEIFSASPVYYLLKPFNDVNVKEAIELATKNLHCQNQAISVISKGQTVNIVINEIQYVESEKRLVKFHHDNEITQSFMKLNEVSSILPNCFVRCHQSYLVNINFIAKISNNSIELYSGIIIPVSKRRFASTKKTILEYWDNEE